MFLIFLYEPSLNEILAIRHSPVTKSVVDFDMVLVRLEVFIILAND